MKNGWVVSRPRVPQAVAKATAAAAKNPQRFRERRSPKGGELGAPGAWLKQTRGAVEAFRALKRELPWLKESHRVVVEMAAQLRAQLEHGQRVNNVTVSLGLQGRQELRRLMSVLGATPADESRIQVPDDGEADPDEEFFTPAARPN
jgi:hypothetical protein